MKATTYIITYQPYPVRAEHCAVGALVFDEAGHCRAHLASSLRKIKALDPQANVEALHASLSWIVAQVNENEAAWPALQNGISALRFSKEPGYFVYNSPADYDKHVVWLLSMAVEPRSAIPGARHKSKSRLFIELRNTFKAYGWLGESAKDIEDHKVVTNYPVSIEEDLTAEFAMKNGVLHLTETVDFRAGVPSTKRMEARSKALVLDFAKDQIHSTICTVVVAAADYNEIKGSMKLLHRYADRVAVFNSTMDMESLFADWAKAMNRPMLSLPPVS